MNRRYRFVSAHSSSDLPDDQRHAVTRLCVAVGVKRGAYYTWKAAEPARAAKAAADAALTCRIREIHRDSRCTYGAKRVALDLAEARAAEGAGPVNHKKVARLMRQDGLEGRHQRRRRSLTRQDKAAQPAPDLLGRDFEACATDVKWCGDITYIPVGESGFIYLATVIDLFSGRLIGWSIADHHRAELVRDALAAAVAARGGDVSGVIFHSDRGSDTPVPRSVTSLSASAPAGACRVPAPAWTVLAESFFATRKCEIGQRVWQTREAAVRALDTWIGSFYNTERLHSAIGYLTPAQAAARWT